MLNVLCMTLEVQMLDWILIIQNLWLPMFVLWTEYLSSKHEGLTVGHVSTGACCIGKVGVRIIASVSRAGVLAGVGKLARLGAKLSTRSVPYVGTVLLAHDVYETFKGDMLARVHQYVPETDKFVNGSEYSNCLWYEDEIRIHRDLWLLRR